MALLCETGKQSQGALTKTTGWLLVLLGCETIFVPLLMEVPSEPMQAKVMFRSYLAYSKNRFVLVFSGVLVLVSCLS